MATLGEFSSLLQLGFGIGAGLSVFRIPVDMRVHNMRKQIDGALSASQGVATTAAREKVFTYSSLKLRLHNETEKLEKLLWPFLWFTAAGAVVNWILLVWASLDAGRTLSQSEEWFFIFASVGYYVLIGLALEGLARFTLSGIQSDLRSALQP